MAKVALITGAGTGVGKVVAHALMAGGYHVVFNGRREDVLQAALDEGDGVGEVIAGDVSDSAFIDTMFNQIE